MATFRIRRHRRPWGQRWTFQLVAENGEPVCSSEPYGSLDGAVAGIETLRRLVATTSVIAYPSERVRRP